MHLPVPDDTANTSDCGVMLGMHSICTHWVKGSKYNVN